jgi:5-methylthioadenosine/S-adenosylhomocysteine deaminase
MRAARKTRYHRRVRISLCLAFGALIAASGCARDKTSASNTGGGGLADGGAGAGIEVGGGGFGGFGGGAGGEVPIGGFGGTIEPGPDAIIEELGEAGKVRLKGWLLTPSESYAGEILIVGDVITCVAPSCSGAPGAAGASVVQTNGIILPGMIDTHNHILFDIFDEDDWVPSQAYNNHNQWPNEARYSAMLNTKQYLNGESGSPVNYNCEMLKYGELKGLVAGTTSIVGAANPANKICYRGLTRTIDQTANGLCSTDPTQGCADAIQVNTLFPTASSANAICTNLTNMTTDAYVIHIGEGVDQTSRNELDNLYTVTNPDGCLHDPRTVIVHGTAFLEEQFDTMAAAGMGLSWSPRSNVFLYGAGTDFTKTTNVPLALSKGITVALSPDWSMGGSANLLEELRFADVLDNNQWGDVLSHQKLIEMVTSEPAKLLALAQQIGKLEVGMKADVTVVGGDFALPYTSVIAATPAVVRMVFVNGALLYGDDQLAPLMPGCELIDICGESKMICVALPNGDPNQKLDQTLAEITAILEQALVDYDAMNLTQWKFAPLTPLVRCN